MFRNIRTLLCALLVCAMCASFNPSEAKTTARTSRFNVREYGAVGDGKTDDTAAFQKALDAAAAEGGGTAFAPTGNYLIKTHLSIPGDVTLEGIWTMPAAWAKGSCLLAVEGKGNADGPPFISLMGHNATLKGLVIHYPEQPRQGTAPIPYPWTVRHILGDNCSIIDVLMVNPYQAVDFTGAGRHYIRNLYGQPLFKGIYVDQCYDVGRIENVHFWPFGADWKMGEGLSKWVCENATAFIFGRTDWQYVTNTFCFGYKIGYHWIRTQSGRSNGNYLGIGADACINPVVVDDVELFGTLITNGEFVAITTPKAASVLVNDSNKGVVNFQNCSFWGVSDQIANIGGRGAVTFTGCNFMQWDKNRTGRYAISVRGGRLTVSGCYFQDFEGNKNDVEILTGAKAAVIMGNQSVGKFEVKNEIGEKAQIGLNVGE